MAHCARTRHALLFLVSALLPALLVSPATVHDAAVTGGTSHPSRA